jgi:hypothetical protein
MCNYLKGGNCHHHGATINNTCGLHIHCRPRDGDFVLGMLKHLAYILILYEDKIEMLHPWHRRVTSGDQDRRHYYFNRSDADFGTNTVSFLLVNWYTLAEVRQNPRQLVNFIDHNMYDKRSLVNLMNEFWAVRSQIVNFSNQVPPRQNGKDQPEKYEHSTLPRYDKDQPQHEHFRTLEFRQHEGVLNADMIDYWAQFCFGVLRLADDMAHRYETDAKGHDRKLSFPEQCMFYSFGTDGTDCRSVYDLFDAMDLPRETKEYFMRRAAYFAADHDGGNLPWPHLCYAPPYSPPPNSPPPNSPPPHSPPPRPSVESLSPPPDLVLDWVDGITPGQSPPPRETPPPRRSPGKTP